MKARSIPLTQSSAMICLALSLCSSVLLAVAALAAEPTSPVSGNAVPAANAGAAPAVGTRTGPVTAPSPARGILPTVTATDDSAASSGSSYMVPEVPALPFFDASSPTQSRAGMLESPAPKRNFSLLSSLAKADQYNKELAVSRKNLPIVAAGIKIAGAIPNPQIAFQSGFGPSFTDLATGQTQQIGLMQQFQTAGKRGKKIELARANLQLADCQLEALRFDVHNRVRRAYAELAAAEAYEALIESQREVGLKLLNIAKKRAEAGKSAPTEMMQANLNVLQYDTSLNQAQGRLQQASAALALITGERPEEIEVIDVDDCGLFKLSAEKTDIVPSPTRSLPSVEQLIQTSQTERKDLKVALQQIQTKQKAVDLARAQRIPDLFIGSGYTYATWAKHQPSELAPQPNWLGNGVYINLNSELPVLYQHQGEILQAAASLRLSEKQADLLRSQIAADLIVAYNSVSVARENIFLYQHDLLPTAADVARIARRGYEMGATDLSTAILAQQQYQQTLSAYFDTVSTYQVAWADLEKAVGAPLKL